MYHVLKNAWYLKIRHGWVIMYLHTKQKWTLQVCHKSYDPSVGLVAYRRLHRMHPNTPRDTWRAATFLQISSFILNDVIRASVEIRNHWISVRYTYFSVSIVDVGSVKPLGHLQVQKWPCSGPVYINETAIWRVNMDGLVQGRRNSIANALELRISCTNQSIFSSCEDIQLRFNSDHLRVYHVFLVLTPTSFIFDCLEMTYWVGLSRAEPKWAPFSQKHLRSESMINNLS